MPTWLKNGLLSLGVIIAVRALVSFLPASAQNSINSLPGADFLTPE